MKSTRVLIDDGLTIQSVGGIGEYSRSLVKALRDQPRSTKTDRQFEITTARPFPPIRHSKTISRIAYLTKLQLFSPLAHCIGNVDVVHYTNFYSPIWTPPTTKYVVTVHDLIGWTSPHLVPINKNIFRVMRKIVEYGIKSADGVVVLTPDTREELVDLLGLTPEKVFVCPNIVKPIFNQERVSHRSPELLIVVGTISRRKNTITAVEAFSKIANQYPNIKLIIAGAKGDAYDETMQSITNFEMGNRIDVVHDLTDKELVNLYKKAALLLIPSHYEGFGIPIIEAMAIGLPVIASSIRVFQEVGGDAIVYFGEPSNVTGLTLQIQNLLSDPDKLLRMSEAGLIEAAKYSAVNVVGRYHHIYETITNS
ncbi:MAG: glycosyltransferase family 4 protein [Chloroflexi bacterium]|nr:glycosyltransferase family 4 protein [Chloroflexota bacterium]